MNTATQVKLQLVLVDESEYAMREHGGKLYWCGDAWSADLQRATVYDSLQAAEQQKLRWIERAEAEWDRLFRPNPAPARATPVPSIGRTATAHDKTAIVASGRIYYATFRGAYDAALAAEFDKQAARAIGVAAGKVAVAVAFPNGTEYVAPWTVEDGDDPEYDHRGRPVLRA